MTERTAPLDVVEAYLLGVVADPERREASFIFRTPSGRQFGLCAHQVDELSMIEFGRQNIVHDVQILGPASDPQRAGSIEWIEAVQPVG